MTQIPYVGETYLSKDKRTPGRTIHIDHELEVPAGKLEYTVTANPLFPKTVGHHGTISPKTIDKGYTKISRGSGYGEGGYGNG